MIDNNTNTEQGLQNTDPVATGEQAAKGKTFTQDEVNRIVSERLARERSKPEPPADDREHELNAREENLKCRELIADSDGKYPHALLKVLDTGSFEQFKATADALLRAFPQMLIEQRNPPPPAFGGEPVPVDPIAKAFKPEI